MLFNSYEFLLAFLPATLALYFVTARWVGSRAALAILVAASLFFYGWWNPKYLALLGFSMVANFFLGNGIREAEPARKKWLLTAGIAGNLALLGWFKYAGFLAESINAAAGLGLPVPSIVLPLAISFFTFQQIAYLADTYYGFVAEKSFLRYSLFVCFFPQLIAGPIVHHTEMLPQFAEPGRFKPSWDSLAVGSAIFSIGLFKKVVLADTVALWADPVFDAAAGGAQPGFLAAWGGALAYTLQLYFDFSGYSDMAVGLARLFNIHLPINFFSPYKARNISDFWRRWHITLSRFLRDYLYIPLGGNRRGRNRRYLNLMVTMLLGGLWHGAGWTFVVWGALHGAYLGIALAWPSIRAGLRLPRLPERLAGLVAWGLTFLAVVVGWVFFRAESFDAAGRILAGMTGLAGRPLQLGAFGSAWGWFWILGLLAAAWLLPNTYELMARYRPALITYREHEAALRRALVRVHWRPRPAWAVGLATGFAAAFIRLHHEQVFLYFQF